MFIYITVYDIYNKHRNFLWFSCFRNKNVYFVSKPAIVEKVRIYQYFCQHTIVSLIVDEFNHVISGCVNVVPYIFVNEELHI